MGETSTNTLNDEHSKEADVKDLDVTETMEADEVIFYHALRTDLDKIQLKPKVQTIQNILSYSRGLQKWSKGSVTNCQIVYWTFLIWMEYIMVRRS